METPSRSDVSDVWKSVPHQGRPYEEDGRRVHWNFANLGETVESVMAKDLGGGVKPLDAREIDIDGGKSIIVKWETDKGDQNVLLENVALVGDLPSNPTNADLVAYGVRNGLLQQGEGIKQLITKMEQYDLESANILKAIIDGNRRYKMGKGTAFIGTMKPEIFSNDPRRLERNPRKFQRYAQQELNDMMGAWVMTRGDKENPRHPNSQAYRDITFALEFRNKEKAQEILSQIGDSGVRRTLVYDTTNPFASLESRRHNVYYYNEVRKDGPLPKLHSIAEASEGGREKKDSIESVISDMRKKILKLEIL